MKNLKYILGIFLVALLAFSCSDDKELADFYPQGVQHPSLATGTLGQEFGVVAIIQNSTVTGEGLSSTISQGICYSADSPTPIVSLDAKKGVFAAGDSLRLGKYTTTMTGLKANTKYYYRSAALSSSEVIYGEVKTFTTGDIPTVEATFESEFFEGLWSLNVSAVPLIGFYSADLYDDGYPIDIWVDAAGNATIAKQTAFDTAIALGAPYGLCTVDGTGKLVGKVLTMKLFFRVSAGTFNNGNSLTEVLTLP